MKPGSGSLLIVCFTLLLSGPAIADPAMEWIQKMSEAMRNLSYRGNFVYLHDNQMESMQITHIRDVGGEKERLLSLNGEAREVIRDNQNLTCIWPSSKKVVVDTSRKNTYSPIFIPEDIVRLEKFYDMKLIGQDRIANMDSVIVHVNPRDNLRYGIKFWINRDNGLMMKSSLINEYNEEVEQVMFTHIEVIPEGETLLLGTTPQLDDSFTLVRFHSGDSSLLLEVDNAWQLTSIPGGFWRESALRRKLPDTGFYVQQMVYTDGLASLSVFIERLSSDVRDGGSSMGAVNAFIRIFDKYSITAIGEVPAQTVKQIAESISYMQQ